MSNVICFTCFFLSLFPSRIKLSVCQPMHFLTLVLLFPPLSRCVCGVWPESAHHTSSSALLSFPFVPLVVNEMCLLPISPSMRPTACDFSVSVQNVRNQLPKRICKTIKQKHTSRWGMLHDLFANSKRFVQPSSSMLVVLCSILTTFELL